MANFKGKQNNHKFISLFSPSWCLKPPPSTRNTSSPSSSSSSNSNNEIKDAKFTNEPSSPRVGCMGQVKRRRPSSSGSTNSSSSSSTNSPSNVNRFSLLMIKRVISSKILFMEMDPPRPVEKRKEAENSSDSLWTRRRCNGGDGIRLQLQLNEQTCV